jgi:hypothetical protein
MVEYYPNITVINLQPELRKFFLLSVDDTIAVDEYAYTLSSHVFLNLVVNGTVKNEGKIVVNKTLTINNKIINNNIIEIGE